MAATVYLLMPYWMTEHRRKKCEWSWRFWAVGKSWDSFLKETNGEKLGQFWFYVFNSLVDEVGDLQIPEMALCKGGCMEPARCGGASL